MTTAISDIDHIVIAVSDLDRASATYRRLGFTLSPRALHSASMGTANHTIMLQHDYFELLTVLTATERNLRWREALALGEGVAGLALVPTSAAAARDAWRGQGFNPSELVSFSRPVDRPGGSRMEARFEIVSLPKGSVPGASVFACAQLTRDAVWLPELMRHANTATAIRRLVVALPNVSEGAISWSKALSGAQSAVINGGIRLQTPLDGEVDLLLRILVGDALRTPDRSERLQNCLVRSAGGNQRAAQWISCRRGRRRGATA